jgi:Xaa-Pro aminopeptidase
MAEKGVHAVVAFGTFQGWQNVFYLSNHWDLVSCYLVFFLHDEPVLFTGLYPHLASARDNAVVRDIRVGGTKSVELLVELLEERGLARRPLGLIEPDSYRLPGIPHRDMTCLQEACSQAELVPCTRMLEAIRRIKSDEEIAILRTCAALTDDCLSRVFECVRPGLTDKDLAHQIASSPGDTVAVLVGSTSMSQPRVPAPAIRPLGREIEAGDVVLIELSKGGAGYAGQVHGMVTLGPATDCYLEMTGLANDAYRAVVGALRPGCSPYEAVKAASMISRAGYTVANPLIHGFGMGIEPGLHVGIPGAAAYWPPADFTFPRGATLTIEPNPCNKEMTIGATAGGLALVTANGCKELQKLAGHDLVQKRV